MFPPAKKALNNLIIPTKIFYFDFDVEAMKLLRINLFLLNTGNKCIKLFPSLNTASTVSDADTSLGQSTSGSYYIFKHEFEFEIVGDL